VHSKADSQPNQAHIAETRTNWVAQKKQSR